MKYLKHHCLFSLVFEGFLDLHRNFLQLLVMKFRYETNKPSENIGRAKNQYRQTANANASKRKHDKNRSNLQYR